MAPVHDAPQDPGATSRRQLLGGAAMAAGGGLLGVLGARATAGPVPTAAGGGTASGPGAGATGLAQLDELVEPGRRSVLPADPDAPSPEAGATEVGRTVIDPRGHTQAGVLTTPPAHGLWVALDLVDGGRETLRRVMRLWTDSIDRLTSGRGTLTDTEPELAALPASLTVTVGWGLGAYLAAGLDAERPAWLRPLPPMSFDELDPAWGDGELLLQVCADDPLTVRHAARQLTEDVRDLAMVRWRQAGYRHAVGTSRPGAPMRNLFGQVDGTGNPPPLDARQLVHREDGSAAMVVRRVRFSMGGWEQVARAQREAAIGRQLRSGAPLTGQQESDPVDLGATDASGQPVIPVDAHVRRAQDGHARHRFLRRPYNYDDAPGDAGQVFVAFCQDVDEQFLPILRRLSASDAMNEWLTHVGSAVFHVLPGVTSGAGRAYLGSHLLER